MSLLLRYRSLVHHISDDLLDEYALKRLPEAEAAALEEHLLICPHCQERLQLTDDFIAALRATLASRAGSQNQPGHGEACRGY